MSAARSLLVELFVEELPPKALKKLGESFAHSLAASLRSQGLVGEHAAVTSFATPRRLAAHPEPAVPDPAGEVAGPRPAGLPRPVRPRVSRRRGVDRERGRERPRAR